MKCCERQAITSVKTLLDHPDIDVTLRDQVRPASAPFRILPLRRILLCLPSSRDPHSLTKMQPFLFPPHFFRTGNRRWTWLPRETRESSTCCKTTVSLAKLVCSPTLFILVVHYCYVFLLVTVSQLELPNEELVIEEAPAAAAPVTTHAAPAPAEGPLFAAAPWPQPAAQNTHGAAAPSLVPVLTDAERQAQIDEMVNVLDRQQVVPADDEEDDVSEMGDTTVREADTVLVEGEGHEMVVVGGVAHWQEENGRLQAEIYMLRNNFPLATTLHEQPIIGNALANNGNNPNNMDEGGDDQSVQTSSLFT